MPLHVLSTCAHHQEVKIALYSLWYHHTDTRGCLTFTAHASYRLGRHLITSALPQGSTVLPSRTATASAV